MDDDIANLLRHASLRAIALIVALAFISSPAASAKRVAKSGKSKEADDANSVVLRIAREFPDGGEYNLKWGGSGTPEEVRHKDQRILARGEGGTYCSGFTFAVVMRAAAERGLLADKSAEQVRKFQKQWYGATDDVDARERQCVVAIEKLDIGKSVTHADARPGDFAQIWRSNKSGHSVVFLGWAEEKGQRVGIKYRSSQKSTNGIGDRVEYFSDAEGKNAGKVLRDRTWFCRLNDVEK